MATPTVVQPVKKSMWDKAICLSVSRGWPSLSKTVKTKVLATTADPNWVHAQKDLYDCAELKKIFSWDAKIGAYLDTRCLPFPLKRGVYMLPIDFYSEVENMLMAHLEGLEPLVDAFADVLDEAVKNSLNRLGDLGNPNDYPTKDQVRRQFKFSWEYLQFNVAEQLRQIDPAILAREQEKLASVWIEAGEEAKAIMRARTKELVDYMMDKLTPAEDGKKKVFHKSGLAHMEEFIKTFDPLNLAGDSELKAQVERMKALTEGVTPEILRSNEGLRDAVLKGFTQIKTAVDDMVVAAPVRSIRFED